MVRRVVVGIAVVLACGCATGHAIRSGQAAAARGDWDAAVAYYREALGRDPGRLDVKVALERAMRMASSEHLARARTLEEQEQTAGAAAEYRLAADLDPGNTLAMSKALELERQLREEAEQNRPTPRIEQLRQQAQESSGIPRLDPRLRVPVLKFPQASVKDILTHIGDATGINVTFAANMPQLAQSYSIDVQDMPLEQALQQVLSANSLTYKVTGPKTIFVYQDNPADRQKYDDLYVQVFYLSHADPAEMNQLLNQLVQTTTASRPIVTPNKTSNSLTVKATLPVLSAIGDIIRANDKPRAEVMIEVEILEVDRTRMRKMGLDLNQWALGFTLSPEVAPPNTSGTIPPANAPPFNLNTISRGVTAADYYLTSPAAVVQLMESDTNTKVLAKPQLRGREGATLTLNLGDDIPVATTTFQSAGAGGAANLPTTSYTYRRVGVNLTITAPRVTYQDEIILPIQVEKSGLGANIDVAGSSLPTFVDRTATTEMRLRDGESNLLAGLLREDDRRTLTGLPGITSIPILRNLFGNTDATIEQTDIVMIVTPHILRGHELTSDDLKPLYVGTAQSFGASGPPPLIAPGGPPPPELAPPPPAGAAGAPPAGAATPPAGSAMPPAGAAGSAGAATPPVGVTPPPVVNPPAAATPPPGVVPLQAVPSGQAAPPASMPGTI